VQLAPGRRLEAFAAPALIVLALVIRLLGAHSRFLNADEAMHYLFSLQPSFLATYQATLHTAHPPLLIILLHYWSRISSSEFFLRIPSVIAGTAAGCFLYAWLQRVADRATALIALALFLFSPALIYLSFEVRQYALLIMFMAAALYFLDRALIESSAGLMLLSTISLYLALLTHYCALIFALCLGVYALLRFFSIRSGVPLISIWALGQLGGVSIAALLWKTHITHIRQIGMVQHVAESYLRGSLFQRGEESAIGFVLRSNVRVFRFLFSQGAVAVVGMLVFIAAIVFLLRSIPGPSADKRPSPRQLAWLFLLPFIVNCAAALADVYPYGASRHNSYLSLFAMPAIATLLARWKLSSRWIKPLVIAAVLAICNFAVAPAGAYIPAKHQRVTYMRAAADWVRASVPPNSIILADYESALLAGYYICNKNIVQTTPPYQLFYPTQCENYESITLMPPLWIFRASTFPEQLDEVQSTLAAHQLQGRPVWLFQAGYIVDHEPEFRSLISQYGCTKPQEFGPNIFVCEISLPGKRAAMSGEQ
jgi:4-amino-4-deoxy-L-arabinose transferase-like glycosyltransferase